MACHRAAVTETQGAVNVNDGAAVLSTGHVAQKADHLGHLPDGDDLVLLFGHVEIGQLGRQGRADSPDHAGADLPFIGKAPQDRHRLFTSLESEQVTTVGDLEDLHHLSPGRAECDRELQTSQS